MIRLHVELAWLYLALAQDFTREGALDWNFVLDADVETKDFMMLCIRMCMDCRGGDGLI